MALSWTRTVRRFGRILLVAVATTLAVMVPIVYAQDDEAEPVWPAPGATKGKPRIYPATPSVIPAAAAATQPAQTGPATREARVQPPGTFSAFYRGSDLRSVLQLLSTQGRRNIIATPEVQGTVTADLYDVTFKQALDAILGANGFVYEEKDNFIYVYTPKQLADIRKAQQKIRTQIFNLAYMTAADARVLLTPVISKDGIIAVTPPAQVGIAASATDAGGNSYATRDILVVRDYEENLQRIADLLTELDVKPAQVLIEATILAATLEETNALGVNISVLRGIDFQDLGASVATVGPAGNAGSSPITSAALAGDAGGTLRTGFADVTGGLSIGILGDRIAAFISALETVTDTTVLANPKLLVINKQRGEVLIGQRQGYRQTTQTDTTISETIEFLETGTRMIVRPYVARNNYIRMEIHPEESAGSVDAATGLPFSTTTEVTSNVMVRDGHTIVIGGLFREETQNARNQVPLVGNIPVLGTLFRRTADTVRRREIIVLLTPHIIQQEPDEQVGQAMKNDVERFRVGARNGLQWFGRERLAECHMRCAKQSLTEGNYGKALWSLDLALSLRPRMLEAIRLREEVTGRAYWAGHARHSSAKYAVEQMIMQELGRPYEGIVLPDKPLRNELIPPDVRQKIGAGPQYVAPLPGPRGQVISPPPPTPQLKKSLPTADVKDAQPSRRK
ncbi:MAG: secretin and TonB N-terminal domain-containing protein [Planctomycetaceae bacterium]|nr:secretin and TonB N-terminal domain-containing protein [Planctomycetaceae bacterium]